MHIRIAQNLTDRLTATNGFVLGCFGEQYAVLALVPVSAQTSTSAARDLLRLLPSGISVVGYYGDEDSGLCGEVAELTGNRPRVLRLATACGLLHCFLLPGEGAGRAEIVDASPPRTLEPSQTFCYDLRLIRIKCKLMMEAVGGQPQASQVEAASAAFDAVDSLLARGCAVFMASSGGTAVLLTGSTEGTVQDLCPGPSDSLAASLLVPCNGSSGGGGGQGLARAGGPALDPGRTPGPRLQFQPVPGGGPELSSSAPLHLDVLCYVEAGTKLAEVGRKVLVEALRRQLRAAQAVLSECRADIADPLGVTEVRAYHFLPPGFFTPVTVLYPSLDPDPETNEARLAPYRRRLHALLGLPLDRPMLRVSNAVGLSPEAEPGPAAGPGAGPGSLRLRDVHASLPAPGFAGTSAVVQGSYDYHHYCQDKLNDAGWGCAYRSLQTLVSWLRYEQYTSKPVPTHRQVQEILVRLGDKPPSFVGSREWVGAIELSYVLDSYAGVTCKIITVDRGADVASHARRLVEHFRTQGSPVMVGGGVLAYTLLGVHFNEDTGECAFLILDPHYTGGEDMKKIHGGTWVGWKQPNDSAAAGGPLFVADAFYNFLCPQRPSAV